MIKITKRDTIRHGIRSFIAECNKPRYAFYSQEKRDKLLLLNPDTVIQDVVDDIIGNSSWTWNECNCCGKDSDVVIQLGQPLDYESRTANVCVECLQKALEMVQQSS